MIKDVAIKVLSGLAVALGTIAFVMWRLFEHERELKRADEFVRTAPRHERDEVIEALGAKRQTHEQTVEALRDEVEKETKREVIDGFKKAFGVRPVVDGDDINERLRGDK